MQSLPELKQFRPAMAGASTLNPIEIIQSAFSGPQEFKKHEVSER
jgi:hypothetical protein